MATINLIGNIEDVDNVLEDIILSEKVELISAIQQIEANRFVFKLEDEKIDKSIDLSYISEFKKDVTYEGKLKRASELKEILDIKLNSLKKGYRRNNKILDNKRLVSYNELNEIYPKVKKCYDKLINTKFKLQEIENLHKSFSKITNIDLDIGELRSLRCFDFKFGTLSKENRIRLKKDYENILAVVFHTGTSSEGEVYLVIYPHMNEVEMNRVLTSLDFKELMIPDEYKNTPKKIETMLKEKKTNLKNNILSLQEDLKEYKQTYGEDIVLIYNGLKLKEKTEESKVNLAKSDRYFYLYGLINIKDKEGLEYALSNYKDLLIVFEKDGGIAYPIESKKNKRLQTLF